MIVNGVDFTGANEDSSSGIPLWVASVDFGDGLAGRLLDLWQAPSRASLLDAIVSADRSTVWGIDAPFGIPIELLEPEFNVSEPLWSGTNFSTFSAMHNSMPVSGLKRQTDSLCPGASGPWFRLRPMTREAIMLLGKVREATSGETGVFPWDPRGHVLEVFPGLAAVALGLEGVTCNSYKRDPKSQQSILRRRAITNRVADGTPEVFPPVALTDEQHDLCIGSDDALDAILAALCGLWHTQHLDESMRIREQLDGYWQAEGMIVGPIG